MMTFKRLIQSMADVIDEGVMTDHVKYSELLDRVRWFFETEEALRTVRLRVSQGLATIGTYRDLAIWAGTIEGDLRKECEDNDK